MTRLLITGAKGRMGQAPLACASRHPDFPAGDAVDFGLLLRGRFSLSFWADRL